MSRTSFFTTIAVGLAGLAVGFVVAQGKISPDEAKIRALVKQLENGWNAHSSTQFAAPFAPNADYVVVNGMYIKGRKAIDNGHKQIFDTIYKDSVNKSTIQSIRFLRPDVAVVHVKWHLNYHNSDHHAMNTQVYVKNKGKWMIEAFHNTPIPSGG